MCELFATLLINADICHVNISNEGKFPRLTKQINMQSKQNISTDARTFAQIWAKLSPQEREDLTLRLYNARCCKTRQTIWKWANGKTQPNHPVVRDTVANVVGKAIGSRVLATTLFPA